MYCKNCGKQISEQSAFCKNCGQKISRVNNSIENSENEINFDNQQFFKETNSEVINLENNATKSKYKYSIIFKVLSVVLVILLIISLYFNFRNNKAVKCDIQNKVISNDTKVFFDSYSFMNSNNYNILVNDKYVQFIKNDESLFFLYVEKYKFADLKEAMWKTDSPFFNKYNVKNLSKKTFENNEYIYGNFQSPDEESYHMFIVDKEDEAYIFFSVQDNNEKVLSEIQLLLSDLYYNEDYNKINLYN